jgi:hypothetical protein
MRGVVRKAKRGTKGKAVSFLFTGTACALTGVTDDYDDGVGFRDGTSASRAMRGCVRTRSKRYFIQFAAVIIGMFPSNWNHIVAAAIAGWIGCVRDLEWISVTEFIVGSSLAMQYLRNSVSEASAPV